MREEEAGVRVRACVCVRGGWSAAGRVEHANPGRARERAGKRQPPLPRTSPRSPLQHTQRPAQRMPAAVAGNGRSRCALPYLLPPYQPRGHTPSPLIFYSPRAGMLAFLALRHQLVTPVEMEQVT